MGEHVESTVPRLSNKVRLGKRPHGNLAEQPRSQNVITTSVMKPRAPADNFVGSRQRKSRVIRQTSLA